jgi:WD40 repeat protein
MPAIFISHSSKDRQVSGDIKAALTRLGFEQAFLDFDKETGLDIGENWEKRLYEELTRCHAVVLALTPAWLASKWCFAELTQARALGKVILPVVCEPVEGRLVLPDIQAVDLVDWNAGGLERLEQRLRAISDELARGFALDPTRPPYPGINAFEKEDAAIYFGRDEESRAVIERLDARRTQGGARFVIIIGASGSGKSSLLKASVLPLLNRRRAQWVILPGIRPEKAPLEALAKAMAQFAGKPEGWRDWHESLSGPDAATAIERLVQDARIGEARGATVLLPVDQFEECFTTTPATERAAFLALLQAAFVRDLPFIVIATGRSDVLEGLIESSELVGHYETFPLTAMPLERYPRLIEGPAAVAGITVEKGLSERIGRDVESKEALPLLAHMLALLYQRGKADNRLNLAEYEALGDPARGYNPIENSIRLAAEEAIKRLNPSERELDALRDAFVPHLVRVRLDDGKRVRQAARRSELPAESLRLIGALTEARLLTTRSSDAEHESLVEVTHEALFKAWPALDEWLTEQQAFLTDLERIRAAHENYAKAPEEQKSGELLYGLLLSRARDWLLKYPQRFISREMEPLRAFIAASAEVADAERARTQRVRRAAFGGMIFATAVFALIAGLAYWQYTVAKAAQRVAKEEQASAEAARSEAELSERRASEEKLEAQKQRNRAEEQAKLAIEERNAALITQSRFLIDKANDVFRDGDYGTSIALALEALPDEKRGITRPHVAAAESILYRALVALREQKTFRIETAPDARSIRTALVSPDGRRVLAGASQTDKRLFDAETGAEIKRISEAQVATDRAVFSRDSRWLVTTARDNVVRVYQAEDGTLTQSLAMQLPEFTGILDVAVSFDGRYVVATSRRTPANLWDAVDGKLMRTLPDSMFVTPGAFSPDGKWLATTDEQQTRVWQLGGDAAPIVIGQIKTERRDEPRASFLPGSGRILVSTRNGLVQVWDVAQGSVTATLFENRQISQVSLSPNGERLALESPGGIAVFDIADFRGAASPAAPAWEAKQATVLAFSPDGDMLATASDDGAVTLWRLASPGGVARSVLRGHDGPVRAGAYSADGQRLITVGGDPTIRIWNGTPGGAVKLFGKNMSRPSRASFSPDGQWIVGRTEGGPAVWNVTTGARVTGTDSHPSLRYAAFLADGKRIALNADRLQIWDTASGTVSVVPGEHAGLGFAAVSPDRKQIAMYGPLHLWNVEAGAPAKVEAKLELMSFATFSPDGKHLVYNSTQAHVIDTTSGKTVRSIGQDQESLESAAYSPDARTLFTGSREGTLRAFDAATLKEQYSWSLGPTAILGLDVSPDGKRIVAATGTGARVFDLATREEIAVLRGPSLGAAAAFSPDGRHIVTEQEELHVWPAFADAQALIDHARSVMPRPLTAEQRKDYFLEASTSAPVAPPAR